MSDAADFMVQILAEPDDDRPRMVFADWLMQHGDPRGELIAVQCRLARHATKHEDVGPLAPLESRERALLKAYGPAWTIDAETRLKFWGEFGFRRGFIESLTFNGGYEGAVDRVRVAAPLLRALSVLTLDELAASPALDGIEEITIRSEHLKIRELDALAASPHAADLRRLGFVYGNPSQKELFALIALPLPLDELAMGFYGEPFYGRLALEHLAKTPVRASLRTLRIRWLRRLGFIRELGAALPNLETLQLESADLSADDIHAIVRGFPKLVSLDLADNVQRIETLDLARLLDDAPNLRRLRLCTLGLGDAHAIAIAESPAASRLVQLDLATNKIGDAGAFAIAKSEHLRNLRRLGLAANAIGHDAKQALGRAPYLGETLIEI
ncbi:MAG: TIGR02996 domain-containing protein [Deltaproteobacteria bacterium]|nr:TIGR02996 domain-containing protein [Deltaproteobacteria bacterium]MDQ3299535.1 TIGR02996 domain-containing protein [Myxococcota bacterium]